MTAERELELARLRPDAAGDYAWDRWKRQALAAGVDPELAQLGRDTMREAVQHDWKPALQVECGWEDQGRSMLRLAQEDPRQARTFWSWLLDTDGGRGRWEGNTWLPSRPDEVSQAERLLALRLLWRVFSQSQLTREEWRILDHSLQRQQDAFSTQDPGGNDEP